MLPRVVFLFTAIRPLPEGRREPIREVLTGV